MSRFTFTPEETCTILEEGPTQITALTSGLSDVQAAARPAPEAWSIVDVLAHLRSCADVWGNCIDQILAEEHPTIKAVNPRSWIKQTDYPSLGFRESFTAFSAQRAKLVTLLRSLSDEDWKRTATVTGAGKALERTLLFYARWLAGHERTHFRQIKKTGAAVRGD
ncbi:MAG: DinB family protein [Chloroflexi bacterium]|nr:DinB family protein [Chloroflexota bacterium]